MVDWDLGAADDVGVLVAEAAGLGALGDIAGVDKGLGVGVTFAEPALGALTNLGKMVEVQRAGRTVSGESDRSMLDQAMKKVLVKATLAKQKASLYKHNVMGLFS